MVASRCHLMRMDQFQNMCFVELHLHCRQMVIKMLQWHKSISMTGWLNIRIWPSSEEAKLLQMAMDVLEGNIPFETYWKWMHSPNTAAYLWMSTINTFTRFFSKETIKLVDCGGCFVCFTQLLVSLQLADAILWKSICSVMKGKYKFNFLNFN